MSLLSQESPSRQWLLLQELCSECAKDQLSRYVGSDKVVIVDYPTIIWIK